MTNITKYNIFIFLLTFGVALLFMSQFYAQKNIEKMESNDEIGSTALAISAISEENNSLRHNLQDLKLEIEDYEKAISEQNLQGLEERLNIYRKASGGYDVKGGGIVLYINGKIESYSLLDILNNLRNSNAEAISINGIRILGNSYVAGASDKIIVDGKEVGINIEIKAIGKKELLAEALLRTGGIISELNKTYKDLNIYLEEVDDLYIPAK